MKLKVRLLRLLQEMLPDIMRNVPAGASTKQLVHFGQIINSEHPLRFCCYLAGP